MTMSGSKGKLLVVGASGLVGSSVVAQAGDWSVLGAARNVRGLATCAMDLALRASIDGVLESFTPDVVVVASAWPWVDGCQRDPIRSHRENVETVENLCLSLGASARVVFFSTEHVFDGSQDAYDEQAPTSPLSVYAKHKREVEALLLRRGRALIVRTSYVFGAEALRKNFMYRVIDAVRSNSPLAVPERQAGIPTWSGWLAASTLTLVTSGLEGIVHLTGPEVLTKAQWARRVASGLGLTELQVVEVPWNQCGQVAPRPERVCLVNTRHSLVHPPLEHVLTSERATFLR